MNLLLFNLKTDAGDDVLGFTSDWIIELSPYFQRIDVITMQSGTLNFPKNIFVYSLGKERGYTEVRRAFIFYLHLFSILLKHKPSVCFAHMTPLFAIMAFPFLKIQRIPILLWYAHKATPLILRLAVRFVDRVVTSSVQGFRIHSDKVFIIGQGISVNKFQKLKVGLSKGEINIFSVARISRIKKIDLMIRAMQKLTKLSGCSRVRLVILGAPITQDDYVYRDELLQLVKDLEIEGHVNFMGAVPHYRVSKMLETASLTLNLCPLGAPDKAGLEGLICGIPLVYANEAYEPLYKDAGISHSRYHLTEYDPQLLADLIFEILFGDWDSSIRDANLLSKIVVSQHGLPRLAKKIYEQICELQVKHR